MTRTELLLSMFNWRGVGLEIGGSYNPLLRRSQGYHVETVDYATTADLRARYAGMINSPEEIEEVMHVTNGRPLAHTVTSRHRYDYIVASHVIEHTPDLVRFLNDCALLLKPEGVLVLAVPDKRHCFDLFQPLTSTGEVLDAHLGNRLRHPSGMIFDYVAYAALRAGRNTWGIGSDAPITFAHDLESAHAAYLSDLHKADYSDCHSWKFTPSSFRLIANDLFRTSYITLKEREFHPSVGPEFYVSLSAVAPGCSVDRITLARNIILEQKELS